MTLATYRTNGNFERHLLDESHEFWIGRLPDHQVWSDEQFRAAWDLHPEDYHEIWMHGRPVKTPRWQQAYGDDYQYTGRINQALPIPAMLQPLLDWSREQVYSALSGILVNWYDGRLGHYIGKHRDSTKNLVVGAPIVTVSFGDERKFRLRPWKRTLGITQDFPAVAGDVFVMPYETNLTWTHEVPKAASRSGRRISVTLRAFTASVSASQVLPVASTISPNSTNATQS